jgi:hypothetical protein
MRHAMKNNSNINFFNLYVYHSNTQVSGPKKRAIKSPESESKLFDPIELAEPIGLLKRKYLKNKTRYNQIHQYKKLIMHLNLKLKSKKMKNKHQMNYLNKQIQ